MNPHNLAICFAPVLMLDTSDYLDLQVNHHDHVDDDHDDHGDDDHDDHVDDDHDVDLGADHDSDLYTHHDAKDISEPFFNVQTEPSIVQQLQILKYLIEIWPKSQETL